MLERLFARLRDTLDFGAGGFEQSKNEPLGLSEGEMKLLKGFVGSHEHDVLLKVLDRTIQLQSENLLNCDADQLQDLRSVIVGLRMAGTLPEQIVNISEKENDLHEQRIRERAEDHARRVRTASYGTPAWPGRNGNDR